jgi:hypothetical protein
MRLLTARVLALFCVLAVTLVVGSAYALANGQTAAVCPAGQLGLTIHWVDAQDAAYCAVADGLQAMPGSGAVIGLVVRGSDDAVSTIDIAPAPVSDPAIETRVTSSRSISSSSSTTCINGHCTTVSNQLVCSDGNCSNQP